jgi:hypothetical protein
MMKPIHQAEVEIKMDIERQNSRQSQWLRIGALYYATPINDINIPLCPPYPASG